MGALLPVPADSGTAALEGLSSDMRTNSPVCKQALARALKRFKGLEVEESVLEVSTRPLGPHQFHIASNLSQVGLASDESWDVLQRAFLIVGRMNERIEDMRNYGALSGSTKGDLPLFLGKFDFLSGSLDCAQKVEGFKRIVKRLNLPLIDACSINPSFEMAKFLDIRSSRECMEFRDLLKRLGGASDAEIDERLRGFRNRVGSVVGCTSGKIFRFLVQTGVGALSSEVGVIVGMLDTFLVDKLFPLSGPSVFVNKMYPSVFKPRPDNSKA